MARVPHHQPSRVESANSCTTAGTFDRVRALRLRALAESCVIRAVILSKDHLNSGTGNLFRMLFPQALRNVDEFLAHIARLGYCVSNRNGTDVVSLERHHAAELALMHQINGANAVTSGQHAIKSSWRAAALDVAQHHGARLKASTGLKLRRQRVTDSAKAHVAKLIRLSPLI